MKKMLITAAASVVLTCVGLPVYAVSMEDKSAFTRFSYTDAQREKIREYKKAHYVTFKAAADKAIADKKKLAALVFTDHPDQNAINSQIDQVSNDEKETFFRGVDFVSFIYSKVADADQRKRMEESAKSTGSPKYVVLNFLDSF